ncbi:MAG: hypothetical protein JSV24_01970, partial [Bacteroidales bacterium]
MIKRFSRFFFHVFCPVIFILPACSSIKQLSIEVLVPPDTAVFKNIHSVSIVYRNRLIPQADSVFKEAVDSILLDSIFRASLLEECVRGVHEALELSPDLERVITDTLLNEMSFKRSPGAMDTLHWSLMEEIGNRNNTGIVIMLDRIHAWDTLFRNWIYESIDIGSNWILRDNNNMLIGLAAQWTIYNLQEKTVTNPYIYIDTVVWTVPYQTLPPITDQLPSKNNAFLEAFYWAGNGYGKHIASGWGKTDRIYYCTRNELMKQACLDAGVNNWMKAAETWKKLTEHKNKSLAAKAAFNMALVCELEDKLELA